MRLEKQTRKDQIMMLFDNPKSMDFTLKPLENFRCGNHRVKFRVRGEQKIDKGELI